MQRNVSTTDHGEVVTTTNGITTVTESVMKLVTETRVDYGTTFDEVTGLNKPLLQAVSDQIRLGREFWDQNVWRMITTPAARWDDDDPDEEYADHDSDGRNLAAAIAYEVDRDTPKCGTALCCAGWVAEIARVDWVVDAAAIRLFKDDVTSLSNWEQFAFIRKDDPAFAFIDERTWTSMDTYVGPGWPRSDRPFGELIAKRGFSQETHRMVYVPVIGYAMLGIVDSDGYGLTNTGADLFNLFDGNNEYEVVMTILGTYLRMDRKPGDYSYSELEALLRRSAAEQGFPEWAAAVAGYNDGSRDDEDEDDYDEDDEYL